MNELQRMQASAWLDINRLASEARMDKALASPGQADADYQRTLAEVREGRLRRALHKLNVASYS